MVAAREQSMLKGQGMLASGKQKCRSSGYCLPERESQSGRVRDIASRKKVIA